MTHFPTPANPAQGVTDDAVRLAGDILISHGLNAPEQVIYRAAREVLETAAIGAGGQAVAWQHRVRVRQTESAPWCEWSDWQGGRANVSFMVGTHAEYEERPLYAHPSPAIPVKEVERVLEEVRDNGLIYWEPNTARGHDQKAALVDRLDALLSRLRAGPQEGWRPTHWHKKRSSTYRVVGTALVQTRTCLRDMESVILYQGEDGQYWVRSPDEFHDGRYEALPAAPSPEAKGGDRG